MEVPRSPTPRRAWRAGALLVIACLTPACSHRAVHPESGDAVRVKVAYHAPSDAGQLELMGEARDRRFLERVGEVLEVVQFPRPLTLSLASCGGESNAWYDPVESSVTFCYEYLADIRKKALAAGLEGTALRNATAGPAVFVLLHESGHAAFDLLQVPVLGREEDAADVFATVMLLRLGPDVALHVLGGAAWGYTTEAQARAPGEGDFADVHALDAQRYYNILCLAYGSDPAYFASAVRVGKLPVDRAEGCREEYQQALFAMKKLIAPSVDAGAVERLRTKHGPAWDVRR